MEVGRQGLPVAIVLEAGQVGVAIQLTESRSYVRSCSQVDVLRELPPKREQIVAVELSGSQKQVRFLFKKRKN